MPRPPPLYREALVIHRKTVTSPGPSGQEERSQDSPQACLSPALGVSLVERSVALPNHQTKAPIYLPTHRCLPSPSPSHQLGVVSIEDRRRERLFPIRSSGKSRADRPRPSGALNQFSMTCNLFSISRAGDSALIAFPIFGYVCEDWRPAIKHLVRTYCVHQIGTDHGRLKEAHRKTALGGDRKGFKNNHALCWEQVPGDNRPPRRISDMLTWNNNVDGGGGKIACCVPGTACILHSSSPSTLRITREAVGLLQIRTRSLVSSHNSPRSHRQHGVWAL